ncbi:Hsp20/alpha crystallin family protein [Natrinema amylolyticum]|uniref:Hsp20/alpha crystallin family protein n=1 Tax=Natrinema amylolyticum TaxID=2878679 RepID=UPI001CF93E33|nr:Hsp20/alpha crystallin family protein [Natrinema amylolyticum]
MSSSSSSDAASFPFPTQFVYEGAADRFRAAVDVAPAGIDDVTIEAGSRRLRIAVDRGDDVVERTVTPLSSDLVFGEDREAVYNNGVLTVSLATRPRNG